MGKTLTVIAREYTAIVKKKSFLIGLILVPVILVLAVFLPVLMMMMKVERQQRMAVIDQTGRLHECLASQLDGKLPDGRPEYVISTYDRPSEPEATRDSLVGDIGRGRLESLLLIPEEVYDSAEVTYIGKSVGNLDEQRRIGRILSEAVIAHRLSEQGLDPAKVREWTKRIDVKTVKVARGEQKKTGFFQEYVFSFAMAFVLYMVLILYGVTVMRGVMEEKTSRMVEILLSSLRSEQLMVGKIVGVGGAGLTQVAVWIGVGVGAMAYRTMKTGTEPPLALDAGTIAAFGVFFVLGFLLYSSVYAMIGSIYSSEQEAQNVQLVVVLPLMVPLMSIPFVIKAPDATLSIVLSMIPFFSPILMFTRINVLTPPILEIAASVLILSVTVAVAMWVAARIYRVGMLMQGKRATLPEIVRWVRQG